KDTPRITTARISSLETGPSDGRFDRATDFPHHSVSSVNVPWRNSGEFYTPLRPFVDGGPKRSLGWPGKEQSVIGQVLGHCRVVAKIGEGGMGVVYRAFDEVLHRDVALKVVKKDAGLDPAASQNLLHEARASSSLAHPNICTIYEVAETDGELYIVMELVEGKTLRALRGDVGIPPESVLRYGTQIAAALSRAHDKG